MSIDTTNASHSKCLHVHTTTQAVMTLPAKHACATHGPSANPASSVPAYLTHDQTMTDSFIIKHANSPDSGASEFLCAVPAAASYGGGATLPKMAAA